MRFRPRGLFLVAIVVFGLCAVGWFIRDRFPQSFIEMVRRAEVVVLYEGLPHHLYAKELLEQERRTKDVQEMDGYPFYREPLDLVSDDAHQLSAVLGDASTYEPFEGEKKCGGFHPDYAVSFQHGTTTIRVLICFGCGEVKVFGPLTNLRHDISPAGRKALGVVLKNYRKNRPLHQSDFSVDQ